MDIIRLIEDFHNAQPLALLWGLGGILALLVLGSLVAAMLTATRPSKDYRELRQRMSSWWVMVLLLAAALLAGWQATLALFAVVSFIAVMMTARLYSSC